MWLNKLEEIGTYEWGEKDHQEWRDADKAAFLTIPEYFETIDQDLAQDEEEEFFIRHRIWWSYNDRVRNGKKLFDKESDEIRWRENCLKLIGLLDSQSTYNKILLAELNRNMGNFETSISLIDSIQDVELKWLAEKLKIECENKNLLVIQLHDGY